MNIPYDRDTELHAAHMRVRVLEARIRELEEELDTARARACGWRDRSARMEAALTDLEMAVSDLMREEDFEISETLSTALDIARAALAGSALSEGADHG
jgi:hypothetical protein